MDQKAVTDGLLALVLMERAAVRVEAAARRLDSLAVEDGDILTAEIIDSLKGHGVPDGAARRLAAEAADAVGPGPVGPAERQELAEALIGASREMAAAVREWRPAAARLRDSLRGEARASGAAVEDMVVVSDGEPAGYARGPLVPSHLRGEADIVR